MYLTDAEKLRDRMNSARIAAQDTRHHANLEHRKEMADQRHEQAMQKIQIQNAQRERLEAMERDVAIELRKLDLELLPEENQLTFEQAVKMADLELQRLDGELGLRDKYDARAEKRQLIADAEATFLRITETKAEKLLTAKIDRDMSAQEHTQKLEEMGEASKHKMVEEFFSRVTISKVLRDERLDDYSNNPEKIHEQNREELRRAKASPQN